MPQSASPSPVGRGWWSFVLGTLLLVALIGVLVRTLPPGPADGRAPRPAGAGLAPGAQVDWPAHGGDPGHTQYAEIGQITPDNVARLQVAWTYRTGDARPDRSQIQCNPIVVRGTLYATSPQLKVFALDAATGRERWVFDPFAAGKAEASALGVNRGVVYWEAAGGGEARILVTAGQALLALDAATGQPIPTFGAHGAVDLREGLGRDVKTLYVLSNTPGATYQDLLILGTRLSEGPGPSPPGHIRAYDVRSGQIRWTFHTIPQPGEIGYDTWPPDAWTRVGGANSWSGVSVDHGRGLVFVPTGSAAFDFWGGNRHGANLFANSLIALEAGTGRRVWHYQFVRHDIWDRDLPQAPILVTVRRDGRPVDAVAQVTKTGHVFLFHRETGEPLFPIAEHNAPASDLEGERTWPTQPLPVSPPPFARQAFTDADITTLTPEATASVRERWRAARTGHLFTPPSEQGSIVFPGFDGGGEWGGSAFDARSGRLIVNGNEMPWILRMVKLKGRDGAPGAAGRRTYSAYCGTCHGEDRQGDPLKTVPSLQGLESRLSRADVTDIILKGRGVMPAFAAIPGQDRAALLAYLFNDARPPRETRTPDDPTDDIVYTHTGYNRFLDPQGYPAIQPPWGTLNAIDLNQGEIVWRVPLGEYPELTQRGIPPTGTENYGGPVLTSTGLVFIGASKDEKFRAFDAATGRTLWETTLPAAAHATPATYAVNGKQYVVVAAGGGKGTRSGDAYVAFALPEDGPEP